MTDYFSRSSYAARLRRTGPLGVTEAGKPIWDQPSSDEESELIWLAWSEQITQEMEWEMEAALRSKDVREKPSTQPFWWQGRCGTCGTYTIGGCRTCHDNLWDEAQEASQSLQSTHP